MLHIYCLYFACEEVISCHSLPSISNGVITFTPGADNSNIGLGSVVTYSCNLGYVLAGQTTRECQSVSSEVLANWTGNAPVCQGTIINIIVILPLKSGSCWTLHYLQQRQSTAQH